MSPSEFFNENYLREYFNRNILKKKGGGRDNLTPEKFLEKYGKDFGKIAEQCLKGTYRFSYYNEKLLLKGSKKYPRVISIPSIRDRLVLGVLNDYLSSVFSDCINHEVPNSLMSKIISTMNGTEGEVTFLRTDFHDFYGTIYIKMLMNMLSSRISDENIKTLIYTAITTPTISGHKPHRAIKKNKIGIPQGLSISNILASIYMLSFDKEFGVSSAELYIRYVDDILFLNPKSAGLKARMLKEICKRNLRLRLTTEKCKSGVIGKDKLDFIGYVVTDKDHVFIRVRNVTNFLSRISAMATRCKEGLDKEYKRPQFIKEKQDYIDYYVEDFNQLISGFKYGRHLYGWLPYFQAITDVSSLYGMDRIIKNRILKDLPSEISSRINSLVDSYYDIRRHGGGSLVKDYDTLETIPEKKKLLMRMGRIDADKSYTDEQINQHFNSYMDYIKNRSEHNIGETS